MKRPLAILFAATLCLGCQAPPGAIDPFIGRQTVPPPGTAAATPMPPGDNYYSPAPGANAGASTSPAGTPYTPPGGSYRYEDSNVATRPTTAGAGIGTSASGLTTPASRNTTTPATRSTTPAPGASGAGGVPVRSTSPADQPPATTTASRGTTSSGFQVNTNPTRSVLQTRTASTRTTTGTQSAAPAEAAPSSRTPAKSDSGGFRPPGSVTRANFEEDVDEPSAQPTSQRTPRREVIAPGGRYGYDPNYRWLRGKLEYSRIDDRWKLRYIPIDGDTDDYGGSVVLAGSQLLDGYQPGQYVTVYGSVLESQGGGAGFAPSFQLDRVVSQADE